MLKDKIGQMLIVGFDGMSLHPDDAIVQAILRQQIGGVILFDYHFQKQTYARNIENPEQLCRLTAQLQSYARQAREAIPLFIGLDYEGGRVNRLKEDRGFPPARSAQDIGNSSIEEANKEAVQMAKTLVSAGINLNFAPLLDLNNNPENPVIAKLERSFSADPGKVSAYAGLFSRIYREHGIVSVYKHFPGHGSSQGDTHAGFVDVTNTWQAAELEPYYHLLPNSEQIMVMTAHVVHEGLDKTGLPASLSAAITADLLRNKLNFHGVIVTDDLQMKAISDNYNLRDTLRLAINAGADVLIFGNQLVEEPYDPSQLVDMIYDLVMRGQVAESRIHESYQRILKLKKNFFN